LTQRAIHRRELGQVLEAIADCNTAIALQPNDLSAYHNRLLFMLADPDCSELKLSEAAKEFGRVAETPLQAQWPAFDALRHGPWRKLRIGFLSPDFRVHSVMYFMEGILAQLDRRQFEVVALHLHPAEDYVTERVKCHADRFVNLSNLLGNEQAQRIRALEIDILIDLAGHTGHNGLHAMAHKAAPIQASWIGYPGTTGLSTVDYVITDAATDPPGVDHYYSETLWRLPTRLCVYRPMSRNPLARYEPRYRIRPAPVLSGGAITFGCCNNLGKVTDQVLRTWARILAATPGSRLLLEASNFDRPEFAARYTERCAELGIPADRLELVPLRMENQYLTYHRIDIALDPFPLNGGTTSMDVLWMGVPLVALEGTSFKSRLSAGILHHLGRPQWLAKDMDGYVRIACELAADPLALAQLRQNLRQEVEQSVLMNEQEFNRVFALNLRHMWLKWVHGTPSVEAARSLLDDLPPQWRTPAVPGVGMAPGVRITLSHAHQQLLSLTEVCKNNPPNPEALAKNVASGCWRELTDLCEKVLNAVPNDAVALSCLAEVELAHGKTEFALSYLQYAQESLMHA
jgi:predicted O-linked N-acetylglucosamine transferase (SPINDLY family)